MIEYEKTLDAIVKLINRIIASCFNQSPSFVTRIAPNLILVFKAIQLPKIANFMPQIPYFNRYSVITDRYGLQNGFNTLEIVNPAAQFYEADTIIPGGASARAEWEAD